MGHFNSFCASADLGARPLLNSRDTKHNNELLFMLVPFALVVEDQMLTPFPTPEFLTKEFPFAARSRMETLTKENLVGAQNSSHCSFQDLHSLSKENQVPLVRTFFLSQVQKVKSEDLGVGCGKMILSSGRGLNLFTAELQLHLHIARPARGRALIWKSTT